jgi:hypothetical protein
MVGPIRYVPIDRVLATALPDRGDAGSSDGCSASHPEHQKPLDDLLLEGRKGCLVTIYMPMRGPIVNDKGVGLMAEIKLTQFAKCGASNLT